MFKELVLPIKREVLVSKEDNSSLFLESATISLIGGVSIPRQLAMPAHPSVSHQAY